MERFILGKIMSVGRNKGLSGNDFYATVLYGTVCVVLCFSTQLIARNTRQIYCVRCLTIRTEPSNISWPCASAGCAFQTVPCLTCAMLSTFLKNLCCDRPVKWVDFF